MGRGWRVGSAVLHLSFYILRFAEFKDQRFSGLPFTNHEFTIHESALNGDR